VSDCVLPHDVEPCNQDGEVSEIRLVSLAEVAAMLEADEFTLEAEACLLDSLLRRSQAAAA